MKFEEFLKYVREKGVENGVRSIHESTGKFLSFLTYIESTKKENLNIVEIGAGVGYSMLCMFYGVLISGKNCMIHGVERRKEIFEIGNKVLEEAEKKLKIKLKDFIKFYLIDAENLKGDEFGEIDIFFLDLHKEGYYPALLKFENNIKKDGIVIAHNVLSHARELKDFLKEINDKDKYITFFLETDPAGISISFKKF
ncbi:MAG: hypothetical protein ABIM83_07110 [candidate division WOR-3 bacterium]